MKRADARQVSALSSHGVRDSRLGTECVEPTALFENWTRAGIREMGPTLQAGLRRTIISAVVDRELLPDQRMPSSRLLAQQLSIARNTVSAVYDDLTMRGFLVAVQRQGHFVASDVQTSREEVSPPALSGVDWSTRLATQASAGRHISKPADWRRYRFPFLYGQVDPNFFPLPAWRRMSRDALGRSAVDWWSADNAVNDDPLLVEQIRRHILPRRGVFADPDQILVTLGAQEGLYLLSRLLVRAGDVIGVENPGYTDARHIFAATPGTIRELPIDNDGAIIDPYLEGATLAIVTPSRQCPTGVTLSAARRSALLAWAARVDGLIIEDDFEGEMALSGEMRALKSADSDGRVVYLGTFSKTLAPGVRLGYMVGPAPLIAEARALRRLIHRSVPLNNQRLTALFILEGHYQGLVQQLRHEMLTRYEAADAALHRHLPQLGRSGGPGSSIWLSCPPGTDEARLGQDAAARGVLFESGDPFFSTPTERAHLRLGLSTISSDRIEDGVKLLAEALARTLQPQR